MIKIHMPDGTVMFKQSSAERRRKRIASIKYIPQPPEPVPDFPLYSESGKHRIVQDKDGKYRLQKKGWFFWRTCTIFLYDVWFWPVYGPGISNDWKYLKEKMRWMEL